MRTPWHRFYLDLAQFWSQRSRDISTKVGAVIVRDDHTQASVGYNDLPRGMKHLDERYSDRDWKLAAIVHAEANAILNSREPVKGMTLYCTFHPCASCASLIVQSGIKRVITPEREMPERWAFNMNIAKTILSEGGVDLVELSENVQ